VTDRQTDGQTDRQTDRQTDGIAIAYTRYSIYAVARKNLNDTQQLFYGPLPETTWVSQYQKKHSPTHTYLDHQPTLPASSIYYDPKHLICSIHMLNSFSMTSLQVLFGLPLGLEPSFSYSIHFFTQSLSSFATHAHTIATCFVVICYLFLVFPITLTLELYLLP